MDKKRKYDETLAGIHEKFARQMELMQRSLTRMKERTRQLSVSQDDKNGILSEIGSIEGWLKEMAASNGFFKARLWESQLEFLIPHFDYLWTTEKDDWWLIEVSSGYDIYQVSNRMSLIIEDDEWGAYVTQQMKEAGNRIITLEEYVKLMPGPSPEDWVFLPPVSVSDDEDDSPEVGETAS